MDSAAVKQRVREAETEEAPTDTERLMITRLRARACLLECLGRESSRAE
jgi:hypothetical protein